MKANEMNLKDSYPVYEISANPYGGNTATLHGVMTSEDNAFLLIGALQGLGENPGNYAYVSPWLKKPMIVRPDGDTAWAMPGDDVPLEILNHKGIGCAL